MYLTCAGWSRKLKYTFSLRALGYTVNEMNCIVMPQLLQVIDDVKKLSTLSTKLYLFGNNIVC